MTNQTNFPSNPEIAGSNPIGGEIRFQLSHSFTLGEYLGTQETITEREVVRTCITFDVQMTINKSNKPLNITVLNMTKLLLKSSYQYTSQILGTTLEKK